MSSNSAHNAHAAPDSAPTILLIENDPAASWVTTQALDDAGYQCVCATTIDEAWQTLQGGPVDAVVSDLHLGGGPRPDGLTDALTLLARLRAHPDYREIPFIVASGNRRKETIQMAKDAGAADYLIKPFPPSDVVTAIRQCLNAKQA